MRALLPLLLLIACYPGGSDPKDPTGSDTPESTGTPPTADTPLSTEPVTLDMLAELTWTNARHHVWPIADVTGDGETDLLTGGFVGTGDDAVMDWLLVPGPLKADLDLAAVGIPLGAIMPTPIGDVDGDGIGDLAVHVGDHGLGIVRGPVGADPVAELVLEVGPDEWPGVAAAGDLDGDGRNELAVHVYSEAATQLDGVGADGNRLDVFTVTADPELSLDLQVRLAWPGADEYYEAFQPTLRGPYDLDGDGVRSWIVAGPPFGNGAYGILHAGASGTLDVESPDSVASGFEPTDSVPRALWDLTGDGAPEFLEGDALTGDLWTGPRHPEGGSDRSLGVMGDWTYELVSEWGPTHVDFDGDRLHQLVSVERTGGGGWKAHLIRADVAGLTSPVPTIDAKWTGGEGGGALGVADLDGDGRDELLTEALEGVVTVLYLP